MRIRVTNRKGLLSNMGITLYFTYILDPFFINSIVQINRLIYYFFALLPVLYTLVKNPKIVMDKSEKWISCCLIIIMIWAFIMSGLIAEDLYFFSDMIKLLFKIIASVGAFIVWHNLFDKRKITWNYEKVFVYAISVYILSSVLFWLMPPLREFWVGLIYNDRQPTYILEMPSYATRYGLAGWSSFGEAYMVLFGELAVIVLQEKEELSKLQFIILNMIMLVGTFMYGRFALIVVMIILIIWLSYTLFIQKKIWILNVLSVVLIIGFSVIILLYNNESTKVIIEWAFEPYLNYLAVGHFSINSTSELIEMYISFNPTAIETIFGVGKWYETSGVPYKLTDVGFMRNIYFGGIGFCLLLYGIDLFISYKYAYTIECRKSFKKIMFIILTIVIIATDLKGSMTFNYMRYVIPLIMANKYYMRNQYGK